MTLYVRQIVSFRSRLAFFDVLVELASLGLVKFELVGFVINVLPGEDLAGLVTQGVG